MRQQTGTAGPGTQGSEVLPRMAGAAAAGLTMQGFRVKLWVSVDGAGNGHAAHVQQVYKVGEPPQLGILLPGHLQTSTLVWLSAGYMHWWCQVSCLPAVGIAAVCQPTIGSSAALASLLAGSPGPDMLA